MTAHAYATGIVLAAVSLAVGQVTLPNGVTVPRDRFIVFIHAGTTHVEAGTTVGGSDPNRPVWDSASPRLWNFNVRDSRNPDPNHAWIPARGKLHAGSLAAYPNWLGSGMPFLKELARQYPDGYYFGILQIANQGDRLKKQFIQDQAGWSTDLEWTQIKDAIAAIGPNTVTWGGLFCVFCAMEEYDAMRGFSSTEVNGMAADAETLLTRVRRETGSNIPLLWAHPAGELRELADSGKTGIFTTAYQQSMLIPAQISLAAVIPVWWLPDTAQLLNTYYQFTGDAVNGHYNVAGLLRLAQEAVAIIKANGWVPSPTGTADKPVRAFQNRNTAGWVRTENGVLRIEAGRNAKIESVDVLTVDGRSALSGLSAGQSGHLACAVPTRRAGMDVCLVRVRGAEGGSTIAQVISRK